MNRSCTLLFLAAAFNTTLTCFAQSERNEVGPFYTVAELQTDFKFLRTKLENTNPDLYLYTAKSDLDLFFDSLYASIVSPLTNLEFYNLVSLLNSKIKDGHTMFLPGTDARAYFNKNEKFLPFYISVSDSQLHVAMNCSSDTGIKEGMQILSINGLPSPNIIDQLLTRQIRDGDNSTYPIWILNNYFKEYFSFSFGHPDNFQITYSIGNLKGQTKSIRALPKDSINFYRKSRYPDDDSLNGRKGIILTINKKLNAAELTIKTFDEDLLKSKYNQQFGPVIEKIFNRILEAGVKNLILDVRNNQGGDFMPAKILLSYLVIHTIKFLPGSDESKTIIPQKNNFKGKLYVLINGGSFSSTAILCSYLDLTKRSVFIGEETGGNKTIISGDPINNILPNTKLDVQISTTKFLIRDGHNTGHGIIPTYHISPTINDIISQKDSAMEYAWKLISKSG